MWQVGVAYLLALENANELTVSPEENIEYDRWIQFFSSNVIKKLICIAS